MFIEEPPAGNLQHKNMCTTTGNTVESVTSSSSVSSSPKSANVDFNSSKEVSHDKVCCFLGKISKIIQINRKIKY